MNKKQIFSLCLLLAASAGEACANGGITAAMLRQMEAVQPQSAAERALANAIAGNKIDDLAKNYRNSATMTSNFNVETPKQSIHDQKSSGRCWMFWAERAAG